MDESKYQNDKKLKVKYSIITEKINNFLGLCEIELERLENKVTLEKRRLTRAALEHNPVILQNQMESPYKWTSSATDFLELVTALHGIEVIVRKDGQKTTKTELINYFSELLHLEVKDPDGKLNKATARNILCPFLDKLKKAFEVYAGER